MIDKRVVPPDPVTVSGRGGRVLEDSSGPRMEGIRASSPFSFQFTNRGHWFGYRCRLIACD